VVLIFALFTYIGNEKKARKNKTKTDPNSTTNQGWARDVKPRDRDETFVALET